MIASATALMTLNGDLVVGDFATSDVKIFRDHLSISVDQAADVTLNTAVSETFPSITNDGTIYFSRASDDPNVEHILVGRSCKARLSIM